MLRHMRSICRRMSRDPHSGITTSITVDQTPERAMMFHSGLPAHSRCQQAPERCGQLLTPSPAFEVPRLDRLAMSGLRRRLLPERRADMSDPALLRRNRPIRRSYTTSRRPAMRSKTEADTLCAI